jgi:hypothetical protein
VGAALASSSCSSGGSSGFFLSAAGWQQPARIGWLTIRTSGNTLSFYSSTWPAETLSPGSSRVACGELPVPPLTSVPLSVRTSAASVTL